jgi:uncharacterized protein (DUF2141 family)
MMKPKLQVRQIGSIAMLLLVMSILVLSVRAQNQVSLTVRVLDARNSLGLIRVALFNGTEGFPGDPSKAVRTQPSQIDPQTKSARVVFNGLAPGTYAVSVFHDENMNGKLDKNFVGIPKEGYGASNNPEKKMRPPAFDEAKFSLNSDRSIEVRLNY